MQIASMETICMKCQNLFSEKVRKKYFSMLKILPSMLGMLEVTLDSLQVKSKA